MHKNGLPRSFLPAGRAQRIQSRRLAQWVDTHDTPPPGTVPATARDAPAVPVFLRVDEGNAANLPEIASILARVEGIRITPVPLLPAAASRRLRAAATAEFGAPSLARDRGETDPKIALCLDADAVPRAHGPWLLVEALRRHPDAVVAYGDELHRDAHGKLDGHWFKPLEFDPLLAEQGMLFGRMVALRRDRPEPSRALEVLTGAERWQAQLANWAAGQPRSAFVHVTHSVLENRRPLLRPLPTAPRPTPDPSPMVSILIPTRNRWNLLGPCLASLEHTNWPRDRLEILVIDNGSDEAETQEALARAQAEGTIRLLRDDGAFNFSRLNNRAARLARGELLVLLNNDTQARNPNWLHMMAAWAMHPEIGAVGCKLLYPDGTIQHAGLVCGHRGGASHAFVGLGAGSGGYNGLATVDRHVSAVTAACLAVRREAFVAVGGMREQLAVEFNDVVLCVDLNVAGYRNVCLAAPLFDHHESKSRGRKAPPDQRALRRAERDDAHHLHPSLLSKDPFYSPCLSQKVLFDVMEAPRQIPTW